MGVHRLHIQRDGLHFAPIGDRCELQHCVEWTLEVGHLIWNNQSKENVDMNTTALDSGTATDYDTNTEGLWEM